MEFCGKKYHVLEMKVSDKRPRYVEEVINKAEEEKDFGVTIQDDLSPEWHINRITGAAYKMVAKMKVAFI